MQLSRKLTRRQFIVKLLRMVKKKLDPRIRGLIEHNIHKNHRSLLVLVGDHGKDQVENLHKILSKSRVKARPSVLWCYKKELGFSTHKKKRMKEIKRDQSRGLYDPDRDDPFELFVSSTNIRWTYYKETEKILGQTFGMCVLQDFEAITPNLLARTIETVEGGGIVIILLKTVKSLKQLYTITMDVHSRFRTEAHHEVVPRFNERFILSLGECRSCMVLDDELNILPISSQVNYIPSHQEGVDAHGLAEGDADVSGYYVDPELIELKSSLTDTPNIGHLIDLTKTTDQAKAVMSFMDAISEKTLRSTISLTAGRGRGKSAAIGICLAGAVSCGYSNIFVTAPSPENLKTVFEFLISGLKALKYTEHLDFEVILEHQGDVGKVVVRVNIFRNHRQTVQYILPSEHHRLAQAELVAIDEAAAIPLPIVKSLMGPYLVFLSSTINGYEGTGRSLSLKLLQQLRTQQGQAVSSAALQAGASVSGPKRSKGDRHIHEDRWKVSAQAAAASYNASGSSSGGGVRVLLELTLTTPIRYSTADPIEKWLNNLLCMDVASSTASRLLGVMPAPKDCELYIVDRDALFSFHPMAEGLLQRIWALYTAAHYKNSPNDLQMLSDAPAHRLFVLLGPQKVINQGHTNSSNSSSSSIPDVLCVVQVAFEGRISQKSVQSELSRGNKASGDLIPWTISQQFNDNSFATLSGARVVRIATHPDVQKMGYGSRAIDLLISYFQGYLTVETIHPSSGLFGGEGIGLEENVNAKESSSDGLASEEIKPRAKLPPLLTPIADRPAERLHWIGASFGLTSNLLNFWSRKGFKVCYLRQTKNDLTGEYSSIVLRELEALSSLTVNGKLMDGLVGGWLQAFVHDYRRRLIALMGFSFRDLDAPLAITLLDPDRQLTTASNSTDSSSSSSTMEVDKSSTQLSIHPITASELITVHLSHHDMQRLELYSRNMVDHHMILDTLPILTTLLFQGRIPDIRLSYLQVAIILAIGLQRRDVDSIAIELNLPVNQVLAFFNKTIRKITTNLKCVIEADVALLVLPTDEKVQRIELKMHDMMQALDQSLASDQQSDVIDFNTKQQQQALIMKTKDLSQHIITADIDHLEKALQSGMNKQLAIPKVISVPRTTNSTTTTSSSSTSLSVNEADKKIPVDDITGGAKDSRGDRKDKKFNKMKRSLHGGQVAASHGPSSDDDGVVGMDYSGGNGGGTEKKKRKKEKGDRKKD